MRYVITLGNLELLDPTKPAPLPPVPSRLAPVAHATLHELVYEKLRNAIMQGDFASGETLTIRTLATQLGTSVMPVREALRRLSAEGALEMLANRSIRVPSMDADRIAEICHLRTLLEGDAAALAAVRITKNELLLVHRHHRDFLNSVRTRDVGELLRAGQSLHFTIYEAARSPTMLAFIGMLWLQSGPWLAQPLRRTFAKSAVRGFAEAIGMRHRAIIDALAMGDADSAASAVRLEMGDLTGYLYSVIGGDSRSPGRG